MSPTVETIAPPPEEPSNPDVSDALPTINELRRRHPLTTTASRTIEEARRDFAKILAGRDRRLALIVGPCSIHDPDAALAYGERIRRLRSLYGDRFLILIRVYLEKPRTTIGWKGFINDPGLDGSCDINRGLDLGRKLLCDLAEMGVPSATELVDPVITPYIDDAIAWASIGARTVESQVHRQLASSLAAPVGFKNGTQGNVRLALDALIAARHSHVMPAAGPDGGCRLTRTSGNSHTHVVLRGGRVGATCIPNWMPESIKEAESLLEAAGLPGRVVVDCSHANSAYDPARQLEIADCLVRGAAQLRPLMGLMLESNLRRGQQKLNGSASSVKHDISITDACLGMEETEEWIHEAAQIF